MPGVQARTLLRLRRSGSRPSPRQWRGSNQSSRNCVLRLNLGTGARFSENSFIDQEIRRIYSQANVRLHIRCQYVCILFTLIHSLAFSPDNRCKVVSLQFHKQRIVVQRRRIRDVYFSTNRSASCCYKKSTGVILENKVGFWQGLMTFIRIDQNDRHS